MSAARRRGMDSGPARRRGRPARLSREIVIEAVVGILEREPREPLTLARVSREVDAVPAALYRYFENLDDLLDSVLARVLADDEAGLDEKASWQEQLSSWMQGLREHLLRYPALLSMIGHRDRTSPAWLDASSVLAEILGRAGLSGRDLAASYLWILEMTNGMAMLEAMVPIPEQLAAARASHDALSERARARFAPTVAGMKGLDGDRLFDFAVEQVVAAVALRSKASRRARRPERKDR